MTLEVPRVLCFSEGQAQDPCSEMSLSPLLGAMKPNQMVLFLYFFETGSPYVDLNSRRSLDLHLSSAGINGMQYHTLLWFFFHFSF